MTGQPTAFVIGQRWCWLERARPITQRRTGCEATQQGESAELGPSDCECKMKGEGDDGQLIASLRSVGDASRAKVLRRCRGDSDERDGLGWLGLAYSCQMRALGTSLTYLSVLRTKYFVPSLRNRVTSTRSGCRMSCSDWPPIHGSGSPQRPCSRHQSQSTCPASSLVPPQRRRALSGQCQWWLPRLPRRILAPTRRHTAADWPAFDCRRC